MRGPRRRRRGELALLASALAVASSACGAGASEDSGAHPELSTLLGAWEGVWVEEWTSADGPPGLRLPPPARSPGSLSIESVAQGRVFGRWSARDPDAAPDGEALREGRFAGLAGGDGKSLVGGRFTNRGVEVISTVLLGPPCALAAEEDFRGGVGPDGGLLLAARRVFACADEDAEGAGAWIVSARWIFYGRRGSTARFSSPS